MLDKLPAQYHGALDTQVRMNLKNLETRLAKMEKFLLEPDDLREAIQELVLVYNHSFGLKLPDLNHPLFLFRYVRELALPREYQFTLASNLD